MMGSRLQCFRSIFKREVKRILADPLFLFGMVGVPVISLIFFLSLMNAGLPKDSPAVVVDMDNSTDSRNLIRQLDAFQNTKIYMKTASFHEAREEIQEGRAFAIYYIPKGFSKDVTSGRRPTLSYYTNAAFLIPSFLVFQDMMTISTLASASVTLQTGEAKGQTEAQVMTQIQPIQFEAHPIGNPQLNYSVYLNNTILPGMLQLMIFLMTVYGIGRELKEGTSREWLKMGNNSITVSLLGKLLPQTLIFTIVGFMMIAVLYGYNSFPLQCGWGPMLMDMFLLIVAAQSVGVLMISSLPILRLGLCFGTLFGVVSFSIIGFSYPTPMMHPTLQALATLFPLRHYFLIYVDQALNGRDLIYTLGEYIWLASFIILPVIMGKHLKNMLLNLKYIP